MKRVPISAWRAASLLWCSAAVSAAAPFAGLGRYSGALIAGLSAFWLLHAKQREGQRFVAAALVVWAFLLSACVVGLTLWAPERAALVVPHGVEYWSEMKEFVASGSGLETDPSRFIPQHLRHLVVFALLSAISGGLAGLVLGAYLTAYMSYYVAQVGLHAAHPFTAVMLAWHPWAVIRVVSFILLGMSLARLWPERRQVGEWWRVHRAALTLASALWAVDLVLKITLASWWSSLLRRAGGVMFPG